MDAKGYLVEGTEATRKFWSSDWLIDHTSLKPLLFPDARVYGKSIYPRSENCTRDTLRSLEKHYYKVWSFLFMCSLFWWVNFSYYLHLYTLKHFQDPPPWAAKTGWPLHFMDLWWMECHKLKFCGVTYGMLESWWRLGFSRCLLKRWVAGVITWWLWDVQRWAKRWWKDVATCNMFVQPELGGSQQMPTALRSWKLFGVHVNTGNTSRQAVACWRFYDASSRGGKGEEFCGCGTPPGGPSNPARIN